MFSPDIMEAADQAKPSEKYMKREEDKSRAIYLLQTSYPVKYGNLNKEVQNG